MLSIFARLQPFVGVLSGKCLLKSQSIFKQCYYYFSEADLYDFFVSLDINLVWDILFAKAHSGKSHLSLLFVIFCCSKDFSLIKSHLFILLFSCLMESYPPKCNSNIININSNIKKVKKVTVLCLLPKFCGFRSLIYVEFIFVNSVRW